MLLMLGSRLTLERQEYGSASTAQADVKPGFSQEYADRESMPTAEMLSSSNGTQIYAGRCTAGIDRIMRSDHRLHFGIWSQASQLLSH